ncbi:LAMI_0B01244g1_1 [Lachancea mirantina]|uniref:DNA-directed RNA polymerase III subunit n=1 Tax=Lachancea mirantina TaxID=1230905 RepID=A0A1G4ITC3_9SACH|nr:LAMI_0B01244g1_1 [Lachancea mirantina]
MSFQRGGRDNASSSFSKNLPFGLSYSDVGVNETTELPSVALPVNGPVTGKERTVSITSINFMKAVRDGPFYTGSIALAVNGSGKQKAYFDEEGTNDGIERYSDRYLKKRKIGVSIDEHPFHLELFPQELYQGMGINKKKLLALSSLKKSDDVFTGSKDGEAEGLSMLEKLKELAEEDEEEGVGAAREHENEGEEQDDEFDDDDDDDDYNAEKYFDDGDDDFGAEEEYGDEPAF